MQATRYCNTGLAAFPPLESATSEGLLAIGGNLSPQRLQCAYSLGIFPWFEKDQPILWWSPDPRCILYPQDFKCSRSLNKSIRKSKFEISFDQEFEAVIDACSGHREGQRSTWITPTMKRAYRDLHEIGCAHSVEVWVDNQLVGGLYGVALGRVFYGESMFSKVRDASKFGLKCLCELLIKKEYHLIDCQVESAHLLSLGALTVPRSEFVKEMNQALKHEEVFCSWSKLKYNEA